MPQTGAAPLQPSETGGSPYQPPRSFSSNSIVILPQRTATDVILERIRVARDNLVAESFLTQERRERAVRAAARRAAKAEKAKERQRPQTAPIAKPKRLIEP